MKKTKHLLNFKVLLTICALYVLCIGYLSSRLNFDSSYIFFLNYQLTPQTDEASNTSQRVNNAAKVSNQHLLVNGGKLPFNTAKKSLSFDDVLPKDNTFLLRSNFFSNSNSAQRSDGKPVAVTKQLADALLRPQPMILNKVLVSLNKLTGDNLAVQANKTNVAHFLQPKIQVVANAADNNGNNVKPVDKNVQPAYVSKNNPLSYGWTESDRCLQYDSSYKPDASIEFLTNWKVNGKRTFCGEKFAMYVGEIAAFEDVLIDQTKAIGARGGEEISAVLNQAEEKEFYNYNKGFFQLLCVKDAPSTNGKLFGGLRNDLNNWVTSLQKLNTSITITSDVGYERRFTVAVIRYEYVNMYHTVAEMYNVFLTALFFDKKPSDVHVLWVDGHPKGSLDVVWMTLFSSANRVSSLSKPTVFKDLAWSMVGPHSPIHCHTNKQLPLAKEFRDFFLSRHSIEPNEYKLDCSHLTVLFVWRRDYLAHPRNPTGIVSRKISNEQELLDAASTLNFDGPDAKAVKPVLSVKGEQIDLLDMQAQLRLISVTDILIGMHGAGLTHALFLPSHAALIELFPSYWATGEHFASMATWRKLHYDRWVNSNPANELPNQSTQIPATEVTRMVANAIKKICP